MSRRSPEFFSPIELKDFAEGSDFVSSCEVLRREIKRLELSKTKIEDTLRLFKPVVRDRQAGEVSSLGSLFAIYRCMRSIARLEKKLAEKLEPEIARKKAELVKLENTPNPNTSSEYNHYLEITWPMQ